MPETIEHLSSCPGRPHRDGTPSAHPCLCGAVRTPEEEKAALLQERDALVDVLTRARMELELNCLTDADLARRIATVLRPYGDVSTLEAIYRAGGVQHEPGCMWRMGEACDRGCRYADAPRASGKPDEDLPDVLLRAYSWHLQRGTGAQVIYGDEILRRLTVHAEGGSDA